MKVFNNERPSVHASQAMVATSQPLASLVGIEILSYQEIGEPKKLPRKWFFGLKIYTERD